MTKGKYGLSLVAIAILAFVLAFFGLLEALILFLAFALILEKDQWLSRQVFQALYLRLAYVILLTVIGWIFTVITAFFGLFNAYRIINFFNSTQNVIQFLLYVGLFAMAAIAVLRLAKGKDAGLPLISTLVDKTFGIITPKAKAQPQQAYQAPQAAPYQAPAPSTQVYQPPSAQTAPPPPVTAPVQEAAPQPVTAREAATPLPPDELESAEAPPAPKTDGSWTCSCGRDNNSNFCMSCGKPRQS